MMWIVVFLGLAAAAKASLIQYLPQLDELRATAENVSRVGHVDVIQEVPPDFDPYHKEIAVCHLAHLMPGSFVTSEGERTLITITIGTWEGATAIALAAEHLNTGNGVIAPEVSGLNKKCNVRFTMESFDYENVSQNDAVEKVIKLTDRKPGIERLPCAVIGPYISRVATATALFLGIRGYAQISPSANAPELDLKATYPLFGRTVPSSPNSAELIIRYLYDTLGVKHLGVLHHPDSMGNGFSLGLQIAAETYAPDMHVKTVEMIQRLDPKDLTVVPTDPRTKEDARQAIRLLKDMEFTYFVSLMYHDYHDIMMLEAFEQGIAGTGKHTWIFTENLGPWVEQRKFVKNSPLHLVHVGAPRFSAVGGIPGLSPGFDKLESILKEFKNDQDIDYLKTVLPKYTTHNDSIFDSVLKADYFLMTARHPAAFAYDAAIAVGLAACNITSQPEDNYFDGRTLYKTLIQHPFEGATGRVVFDPATGSREIESMEFELVYHQLDDSRETENEIGFKLVRAAHFQDNQWKELEPLMFNDGTTRVPADLPTVSLNENLLTPGLRAGGLVMCGTIVCLALACSMWTQLHKLSRVVKSSQPVFLHIICAGVLLLGSSIIPLSVDYGVASQKGCDAACMAFPWLLVGGFSVTFSALYAKTERVHRIIRNGTVFNRAVVTVGDVYRPMILVLGANIVVLASWTAVAPLQMGTEVKSVDMFGRSIETYSFCNWSDLSSVPFYATLGTINFGLLCYAMVVAWRAREISTEFSESEYIFKAMGAILLVCFVGIPVMIIASENPSAFFFLCSSIIFVASTSILLLIFCPKLLAYYKATRPATPSSLIPERFRRVGRSSSKGSSRRQVCLTNDNEALGSAGSNGNNPEGLADVRLAIEITNGVVDSSSESDTGVKILADPKTIQEFRSEIERLTTEVERLQSEVKKFNSGAVSQKDMVSEEA